jgi:DNA-binding IclR family transcriptional regulator
VTPQGRYKPPQAKDVLLDEVREMAPVTAGELARGTGMSERNVRRLLAELEQAGLVESDDYQRRARVWMPK